MKQISTYIAVRFWPHTWSSFLLASPQPGTLLASYCELVYPFLVTSLHIWCIILMMFSKNERNYKYQRNNYKYREIIKKEKEVSNGKMEPPTGNSA